MAGVSLLFLDILSVILSLVLAQDDFGGGEDAGSGPRAQQHHLGLVLGVGVVRALQLGRVAQVVVDSLGQQRR